MPNLLTLTGKTGPNMTLTAREFVNPRSLNFQYMEHVLAVTQEDGKVVDFDLNFVTAVTYEVANSLATVTIV